MVTGGGFSWQTNSWIKKEESKLSRDIVKVNKHVFGLRNMKLYTKYLEYDNIVS